MTCSGVATMVLGFSDCCACEDGLDVEPLMARPIKLGVIMVQPLCNSGKTAEAVEAAEGLCSFRTDFSGGKLPPSWIKECDGTVNGCVLDSGIFKEFATAALDISCIQEVHLRIFKTYTT